ncbi:hypothetical protein A2U01_0064643, partial [Trifolium medium]|nr:hypothetical protein [Trifolium medium]
GSCGRSWEGGSIALVKQKVVCGHGKRGGRNVSSGGKATVMPAGHGIVGDSPWAPRPLGYFSLWIFCSLGLILIHRKCYWAFK